MKHIQTITLKKSMSFKKALVYMNRGRCIGIKPGANTGFLIPHGRDGVKWNGTEDDRDINTEQYLGEWFPVIIDSRDFKLEEGQRFF